jgi:hypothetical protein
LDPGEAVDVMDLIEYDEGKDFADTIDGFEEIECLGVMVPGS